MCAPEERLIYGFFENCDLLGVSEDNEGIDRPDQVRGLFVYDPTPDPLGISAPISALITFIGDVGGGGLRGG